MKKKSTIIVFLPLIALIASICFAAPPAAKQDVSRHAKARYYFVEGSVAMAEGRMADAYELIGKATKLDPDYTEASYNYALIRMTMRNDTLQSPSEVGRSIALMRPFVDKYPEESGEAMNYSYLAARSGDLDEAIRVAERTDSITPDLTSTLLQLMQYYSLKQDYDKAIGALDKYERIEGNDPEISLRKFALMLSSGDTLRLLDESRRLVKENPINPDYMLIRGNVFEALERPDSALVCYLNAETLDPDNGRTKLTLANFYLERGDSLSYDTKSREALLSENIMLEEKLDMMSRYMRNIIADSADTSRGTRLFDGLLAQYPHEPKVLDLGSQYFAAIGNLPRAEELMAYATDLDADNPDYWLRLASLYYSDGKYKDAEATCEKAMRKLSEPTRGLLTIYGAAAMMSEDYEKAMNAYQRQLDMDLPGVSLSDSARVVLSKVANLDYDALMRIASVFAMAGDCSSKMQDMDAAIRDYEVAMAIDPTNVMSMNNYAYFLALARRDLDKAESLSRKAVADSPENPTYLDTLAWILYLKGDYQDALDIQVKALEFIDDADENTGEYWDHLGDIQFRLGMKEKALENWKKAKSKGSDNIHLSEKIRTKKLVE